TRSSLFSVKRPHQIRRTPTQGLEVRAAGRVEPLLAEVPDIRCDDDDRTVAALQVDALHMLGIADPDRADEWTGQATRASSMPACATGVWKASKSLTTSLKTAANTSASVRGFPGRVRFAMATSPPAG